MNSWKPILLDEEGLPIFPNEDYDPASFGIDEKILLEKGWRDLGVNEVTGFENSIIWFDVDPFADSEIKLEDEKKDLSRRLYRNGYDLLGGDNATQLINHRFSNDSLDNSIFPKAAESADKFRLSIYHGANSRSLVSLGILHELGIGVTQSIKDAFFCFELAAKSGDCIAVYNIGTYLQRGWDKPGGVPNMHEALKQFIRANKMHKMRFGFESAYALYGMATACPNVEEANRYLHAAAQLGSHTALYNLGHYQQAAEMNYAPAQFEYAQQLIKQSRVINQQSLDMLARSAVQKYGRAIAYLQQHVTVEYDRVSEHLAKRHGDAEVIKKAFKSKSQPKAQHKEESPSVGFKLDASHVTKGLANAKRAVRIEPPIAEQKRIVVVELPKPPAAMAPKPSEVLMQAVVVPKPPEVTLQPAEPPGPVVAAQPEVAPKPSKVVDSVESPKSPVAAAQPEAASNTKKSKKADKKSVSAEQKQLADEKAASEKIVKARIKEKAKAKAKAVAKKKDVPSQQGVFAAAGSRISASKATDSAVGAPQAPAPVTAAAAKKRKRR